MMYPSQPSRAPGSQPSPRHRRHLGIWLGGGSGIAAVVVIVLVVVLVAQGSPGPHGRSSAGAGSGTSRGLSNGASGPSACVEPGKPAAGSGPWKLVQPRTLCGLPPDNSVEGAEGAQEDLSAMELLFDPAAGQASPGSYASAFSVGYQIPRSEADNFDRFINVVGFTGTFNPQTALSELAQLDENPDIPGNVFKSVPPGPHGGLMECAPNYGAEECIFATSTTLGDFTIDDTLHELTGANTAANAIRIRDALEVPA